MRNFLRCPKCDRIDPVIPEFNIAQDIMCQSCAFSYWAANHLYTSEQLYNLGVKNVFSPKEQMKLDDILSKSFKKPGGKTLKLEIARDTTVTNAVSDALEYLNHESNIEHNRIEFKYGRNYIVVAKLKDES